MLVVNYKIIREHNLSDFVFEVKESFANGFVFVEETPLMIRKEDGYYYLYREMVKYSEEN